MKYEIEIPDEIEQALEKRASATGDDMVHLIQKAVVYFVRSDVQSSLTGRRPDATAPAEETVAPLDLPRSAPGWIPIERTSHRHPDPIADTA